MNQRDMTVDFAALGFRASRWRASHCWERLVSNGRTLCVTGPGNSLSALEDGELDVFLSHELYGSERVLESWPSQCMQQVRGILVQVENNVEPLRLTTIRGVPFVCRLLVAGDRYGHDGCHVVEAADQPRVAFYDARYRSSAYGQFVGSLYDLDEFLTHDGLLRLNEGDREWTLDAASVAITQAWARLESARAAFEKGWRPLAEVRRAMVMPDAANRAIRNVASVIGGPEGPARTAPDVPTDQFDSHGHRANRTPKNDFSM